MTTLTATQLAGYAYRAGFRGNDVTTAVAVALAESGGETNIKHRNSDKYHSIDYGTWQINDHWHSDLLAKGSWSDPAYNAKMAYIIKTTRGGWPQWSTFKHGTYLRFMPEAIAAAKSVNTGGGINVPDTNSPAADMGSSGNGGIGDAVSLITNPHTWLRLAMISAGSILILVSLAMLGWSNTPDSVKTIAEAVVLKKVPIK